jgi:hypothetical protein
VLIDNAETNYLECLLRVKMPIAIMNKVIWLSVIMLSVVAPFQSAKIDEANEENLNE